MKQTIKTDKDTKEFTFLAGSLSDSRFRDEWLESMELDKDNDIQAIEATKSADPGLLRGGDAKWKPTK